MFDIAQLVWILASDESGNIMPNQAPVLILAKYIAVPRAFPWNDEANELMVGSKETIVYDILCDGCVEHAIDEEWLDALTDSDLLVIMDCNES